MPSAAQRQVTRNSAQPSINTTDTASQANKENTQCNTQDCCPSAKVAAQLDKDAEKAHAQADADACHAQRAQKAQRQREKEAGIDSRADSDLEERPDTMFISRLVISKPATLAQRTSRIPPPCPIQSLIPRDDNESNEDCGRPLQPYNRQVSSASDSMSPPPHDVSMDHRTLLHSLAPAPESPAISRSPSLAVGHKRQQEQDNHDTEMDFQSADYDDVAKEVILKAASKYRCLICLEDTFPDMSTEISFIKLAWMEANQESGMPFLCLTSNIAKIIKARGSQTRGELKTKTASLVEALYGFESGQNRKMVTKNHVLAEELKHEKGYLYREINTVNGECKGLYQHPIIQKAVNAMWFKNKCDKGIIYSGTFNPLPVQAIAMVLTGIECNIDKWAMGVKTNVTFWADEYHSVYQDHIKLLQAFSQHTKQHDLVGCLQHRLHNYGWQHAGAPSLIIEAMLSIPISAFQAAAKEYEEDTETDDEGSMLGA